MGPGSLRVPVVHVAVVCAILGRVGQLSRRSVQCTTYEAQGHLVLDLKEGLPVQRADMYADSIENAGASLHSCVGFIDCTKTKMTRLGGHSRQQRGCYKGHQTFHCLIYQTVTTPDGLLFNQYGTEAGRSHDVTPEDKVGSRNVFETVLTTTGDSFTYSVTLNAS